MRQAARRPGAEPRPKRGASREDELLRAIGARIRAARVAAALSQESAAARAKIDYKRWQKLEQGAVNPTARTLLRVAEAVETSFWDLLQEPTTSTGGRPSARPPKAKKGTPPRS